jgi:hypothetical protein
VAKIINGFTLFLFGLFLIAPGALMWTNTELTGPLEEKRTKIERPGFLYCVTQMSFDECHQKIDAWFNDNYAPRDLLIKLKTQIDYSLFLTSSKVHIGPSSWLFYRSVMDVEKVLNERLEQAEFDRLLSDLDALDHYLGIRDIQLVVLPIPLKDTIYPENLPGSAPNLPADSRYQQLRQWLADHETIISVDAYQSLVDRKKEARAFHKTDFHWNDPAAFRFAEAVVNHLWSIQSGRPGWLWDSELFIEKREYSGGQANFLPLLSTPTEQGLFLAPSRIQGGGNYNYQPGMPWTFIYDGPNEERGKLGGAVIYGDSFFDAMNRSGIETFFSSVHQARDSSVKIGEIYSHIPEGTRYFIFEFIEVRIFGHVLYGLSVPEPAE